MIMPVILWTDALVFLLLVAVTGFAFYARRKPHLRSPWHRIFTSRMAVIAGNLAILAGGMG